jgi:outer membrane immunogenic protein
MRLKWLYVGMLLATFGAGSAWADGIRVTQAPMSMGCGGQFSGTYIGGQVGYLDHDATFHDEIAGGHESGDDNSVTFGVYGGYNVQCGRVLYGIESDFNSADTDADWNDSSLSSEMNWFGTLRGRLGIVHEDKALFYVTGGLAYADFDYSILDTTLPFSQSNGDTKFGWTIGGGIELIRDARWSIKAEALYVDLGKETVSYEFAGCGLTCEARVGYENDFWTARLGLAYHFGVREEVAAPLK